MEKKAKNKTHKFSKPVSVLRYFPQKMEWNKAEYRALPSHVPNWDQFTTLKNGCIRDDRFLMHSHVFQGLTTIETNTILLWGADTATRIDMYKRAHKLPNFLNLYHKNDELWVECCDDYYPTFGSKKRDRFDILPLLPGKSAAIHINARYWHTMMGKGTDTHYVEKYLYLEHLGTFQEVTLLDDLEESFMFKPQQEVDLRHMMY
jgi:hypothetical protein